MPHRILVIDDAPDLALVMRMLLERAGHEVISADNGRLGLRRFFELRPDLVVLDLRMPDLDGWETLERLRDLSDVPVLIVSGLEPAPEELERLRPGRDAFLPKPALGPRLIGQVGELLAAA
jgi:DNA-binding response OmpR family regulator